VQTGVSKIHPFDTVTMQPCIAGYGPKPPDQRFAQEAAGISSDFRPGNACAVAASSSEITGATFL
jgi:hypothetical protein